MVNLNEARFAGRLGDVVYAKQPLHSMIYADVWIDHADNVKNFTRQNVEGFFTMEISSACKLDAFLDITRNSCEKCNFSSSKGNTASSIPAGGPVNQ